MNKNATTKHNFYISSFCWHQFNYFSKFNFEKKFCKRRKKKLSALLFLYFLNLYNHLKKKMRTRKKQIIASIASILIYI